jgi:hypothetical protein
MTVIGKNLLVIKNINFNALYTNIKGHIDFLEFILVIN